MKTLIAFLASFNASKKIPDAKKKVKEYLGTRLIEDQMQNAPFILCNTQLNEHDIQGIDKILDDYEGVKVFAVFMEDESKCCATNNLALLQIYQDGEEEI